MRETVTKIMLVDDDQDLRESTAEVLENAGFSVTKAASGEESLEHLNRMTFDLVLLDLVMPGMGGMELLDHICDKEPRLPVIIITAFASIENAVTAMQRGAAHYVSKPFRIDTLLASVGRVLAESRFQHIPASLDLDTVMRCLSNPLRREILSYLDTDGPLRFMEICRKLQLSDHTKMNFHLKNLKDADLLMQDTNKIYTLTPQGVQVIAGIQVLMKNL